MAGCLKVSFRAYLVTCAPTQSFPSLRDSARSRKRKPRVSCHSPASRPECEENNNQSCLSSFFPHLADVVGCFLLQILRTGRSCRCCSGSTGRSASSPSRSVHQAARCSPRPPTRRSLATREAVKALNAVNMTLSLSNQSISSHRSGVCDC